MKHILTTPIYYASGEPHLGHMFSTLIADVHCKFLKLKNQDAFLLTGTDEHGLKIQRTSCSQNKTPQEFVDEKSKSFSQLWVELQIYVDRFIRTTDLSHRNYIHSIWKTFIENGDIYLGTYSGKYCVECEQYYSDKELLDDDICPIHKKSVEVKSEETFLFRLEKYRKQLLNIYEDKKNILSPNVYIKEIKNMLLEPLEDLSVSRKGLDWGVSVPDNSEHSIYVWIDALFSYISSFHKVGESRLIHVIGKDILKFHGIYWPIFLMALDKKLPRQIIITGWWTIDGEKISKSNPNTFIDPRDLVKELTNDGLRYALLKQKPISKDGDFNVKDAKETVNSDLANSLGNLCKRSSTILMKLNGFTAELWKDSLTGESASLFNELNETVRKVTNYYEDFKYDLALRSIRSILDKANQYFHDREPWLDIRQEESHERAYKTVQTSLNVVYVASQLLEPITTNLSEEVYRKFGKSTGSIFLKEYEPKQITLKEAPTIFSRLK